MNRAVRAAISLPVDDFRLLEAERKRVRKPRSEVVREALRAWFRNREREELETKYVEGYRKDPVSKSEKREIDALSRATYDVLKRNEW